MDYKAIEVKRQGGVTWLYFNRPEKKNAMNPTLHREMYAALSELDPNAETRVLIINWQGRQLLRWRRSQRVLLRIEGQAC